MYTSQVCLPWVQHKKHKCHQKSWDQASNQFPKHRPTLPRLRALQGSARAGAAGRWSSDRSSTEKCHGLWQVSSWWRVDGVTMLETSNHFKQTGLIQKANGSVLVKIQMNNSWLGFWWFFGVTFVDRPKQVAWQKRCFPPKFLVKSLMRIAPSVI